MATRNITGGLNTGQRKLIKSESRNVLLSGGYGSGKTFGGSLKSLQLRQENKSHGLIIAPTYQHLFAVSLEQLFTVLRKLKIPPNLFPKIADKQFERYLDFGDGKKIYLRSADNPGSLEGLNVGWVWMDESRLVSEKAKNIAKGRMRTRCKRPQFVCTSTPDLGWLYEEFMSGKPDREIIKAPTYENMHNLGDGFVEDLRFSYSKRLQDAVIEGEFTVLEGAVYESFSPSLETSPWIVPYSPVGNDQRKTTLAIDPGFRSSSWHWWHQVSPDQWICFDQFQGESMSTESCIQYIRQNKPWPIDEVWCDPAADATDQTTGLDSLDFLKLLPWRINGRTNIRMLVNPWRNVQWGIERTRVMLGEPDGKKMLLFSSRIYDEERGKRRGIIKSLAAYRYPEAKHGRPLSPVPLKDGIYDHDCDALRYLSTGQWLTAPNLRQRCRDLAKVSEPGFRIAA